VLYAAIPNKELTYDRTRQVTPVSHLEQKYIAFDFTDTYLHALDIVRNSIGHKDYENQGEEMAKRLIADRDGHHHFYVYDPDSVLELIQVLSKYIKFRLEFFNLDGANIHFALRKL
jgi:hypothetical protein